MPTPDPESDPVALLSSAINKAWDFAYPGEPAVTDIKKLCNRAQLLANDRSDMLKTAKALQADNNKLRGNAP